MIQRRDAFLMLSRGTDHWTYPITRCWGTGCCSLWIGSLMPLPTPTSRLPFHLFLSTAIPLLSVARWPAADATAYPRLLQFTTAIDFQLSQSQRSDLISTTLQVEHTINSVKQAFWQSNSCPAVTVIYKINDSWKRKIDFYTSHLVFFSATFSFIDICKTRHNSRQLLKLNYTGTVNLTLHTQSYIHKDETAPATKQHLHIFRYS